MASCKAILCVNCERLLHTLKMRLNRTGVKKTTEKSAKKNYAYMSHEDLKRVLKKQAKRIKILERWKSRATARLKVIDMVL